MINQLSTALCDIVKITISVSGDVDGQVQFNF